MQGVLLAPEGPIRVTLWEAKLCLPGLWAMKPVAPAAAGSHVVTLRKASLKTKSPYKGDWGTLRTNGPAARTEL